VATVFALENLFDAVVAQFAADSVAVQSDFGWRFPPQKLEALDPTRPRRIVWVPGDDDGTIGTLGPVKQPGRLPRSIGTLAEACTVLILAVDSTALENERAQYHAARALFDQWYRACYLAAYGTFEIESVTWMTAHKERRYGAGIRVLLTIDAMIPDDGPDSSTDANEGLDLTAELATTLKDVTETDTVTKDSPQ
jgi:hypothetical protein